MTEQQERYEQEQVQELKQPQTEWPTELGATGANEMSTYVSPKVKDELDVTDLQFAVDLFRAHEDGEQVEGGDDHNNEESSSSRDGFNNANDAIKESTESQQPREVETTNEKSTSSTLPSLNQQLVLQPTALSGILPAGSISNGSLNISDIVVDFPLPENLPTVCDAEVDTSAADESSATAQLAPPPPPMFIFPTAATTNDSTAESSALPDVHAGDHASDESTQLPFESVQHLDISQVEEGAKMESLPQQQQLEKAGVLVQSDKSAIIVGHEGVSEKAACQHQHHDACEDGDHGESPAHIEESEGGSKSSMRGDKVVDRSKFADVSKHALEQLEKAKEIFLSCLCHGNFANGPYTAEIVKFHMVPRCRRQFNHFVRDHNCHPYNRQITEAERQLISKGRKTPLWFSSVTFTHEAQRLFLEKMAKDNLPLPERLDNLEALMQPLNLSAFLTPAAANRYRRKSGLVGAGSVDDFQHNKRMRMDGMDHHELLLQQQQNQHRQLLQHQQQQQQQQHLDPNSFAMMPPGQPNQGLPYPASHMQFANAAAVQQMNLHFRGKHPNMPMQMAESSQQMQRQQQQPQQQSFGAYGNSGGIERAQPLRFDTTLTLPSTNFYFNHPSGGAGGNQNPVNSNLQQPQQQQQAPVNTGSNIQQQQQLGQHSTGSKSIDDMTATFSGSQQQQQPNNQLGIQMLPTSMFDQPYLIRPEFGLQGALDGSVMFPGQGVDALGWPDYSLTFVSPSTAPPATKQQQPQQQQQQFQRHGASSTTPSAYVSNSSAAAINQQQQYGLAAGLGLIPANTFPSLSMDNL